MKSVHCLHCQFYEEAPASQKSDVFKCPITQSMRSVVLTKPCALYVTSKSLLMTRSAVSQSVPSTIKGA